MKFFNKWYFIFLVLSISISIWWGYVAGKAVDANFNLSPVIGVLISFHVLYLLIFGIVNLTPYFRRKQ